MKKIILLFIIQLFLFAPRLQAQNFWEQLPFPDTLDISCVAVNNEGVIFVTTNTTNKYDGIFRSTDSGQTWQQVFNSWFGPMSITIDPNGVIYAPVNQITGNYLVFSSDLGENWDSLTLPQYGSNVLIRAIGTDTLYLSQWPNGAVLLRSTNAGHTWTVIFESDNGIEHVSDIAFAPNNDIYLSLMCFSPNSGGVYKSTDNGATWQEIGMLNHQVQAVEINEQGDVFIGVFFDFLQGAGGLYALYHDSLTIDTCLYGPSVNGIAINSVGDIYAGIGWPDGVIVSKDNGLSFKFENSGLIVAEMGELIADTHDYIYALYNGATPYLYRSSKPTVTALPQLQHIKNDLVFLYPNPAHGDIKGMLPPANSFLEIKYCNIYQINGKWIAAKEIKVESNTFSISISDLPPGEYIMTIRSKKHMFTGKFIKQ